MFQLFQTGSALVGGGGTVDEASQVALQMAAAQGAAVGEIGDSIPISLSWLFYGEIVATSRPLLATFVDWQIEVGEQYI